MPSCKVARSTSAEKQTIRRGLTLNPSSWFSKPVLLQTLGLEEGSQTSFAGGSFTRNPVLWAGSASVVMLLGKGPTTREVGSYRTVVCAAKTLKLKADRKKNGYNLIGFIDLRFTLPRQRAGHIQ
jgi:hypothetical protein